MGRFPHDKCAAKVRGIQAFHMDRRRWDDIAYSFVVCPHGAIYEGRGWGVRTAANGTDFGNDHYFAACYLGGEGDPFTEEAKQAYRFLEWAFRQRYGRDPEVRPHSSFKTTACPGPAIRTWIATGRPVSSTQTAGDGDLTPEQDARLKNIETVLARMEGAIGVDGAHLSATEQTVEQRLVRLEQKLDALAARVAASS